MKHLAILVTLSASLALACSHARSVGPAETAEPQTAAVEKPDGKRHESKKPAHHASDGDTPIATSPSALLEPGAVRAIQERLARSGDLAGEPSGELDGPTRSALTRYQSAHDLPATGTPDDATVKKLGLDPKNVFQAGPAAP